MDIAHGFEIAIVAALSAALVTILLVRRGGRREQRYLKLLDQLPNLTIVLIDRDLRVRSAYGEGRTLDGEEVVGRRVEDLLPGTPETAALIDNYRAGLAGEERRLEYPAQYSDQSYSVRTAPLREGRQTVGVVAVFVNVSQQRELSQQAAQREVILDLMNEAYVSTDSAGVVTGWNRAAETTFGYAAGEAIGRALTDLIVPPEDRDEFRAILSRSWPGIPETGRFEIRTERTARAKDGRVFPVELAATIAEVDGETVVHGLMHDITDRKASEAELQAHADDFAALAEAVGELARSTVASAARETICRAAMRLAGADAAALIEADPSGTGLRTTASEGIDIVGEFVQFTEPAGSVRAFSSREPFFVADVAVAETVSRSFFRGRDFVSVYWVPVLDDGQALGVITIGWHRQVEAPAERLERLMSLIAAEAAVAIERAALLDRLERMAHTDDLTGLINRRAWDHELEREIGRARRTGSPLAVAMLDLDLFKEYNDRHGHQAGDRVLREAASAWRTVLRDTDLLARYGGEEFAVALPGCDLEHAGFLVDRLREVTPAGQSCSAGLAFWDGEEVADRLLGRADTALYEAKQRGRDRTVVA